MLKLFMDAKLDAVVLEIGLGGRLDAIDSIDPTVSIVTTVGIDHTAFLGPDRESIGREKSFGYRPAPGHAAVCADPSPRCHFCGTPKRSELTLRCVNRDFRAVEHEDGTFDYEGRTWSLKALPRPALAGEMQIANAAGALAMLEAADELKAIHVEREAIETGLRRVVITGRFRERVAESPAIILDAGDNPHAAHELARNLASPLYKTPGKRSR